MLLPPSSAETAPLWEGPLALLADRSPERAAESPDALPESARQLPLLRVEPAEAFAVADVSDSPELLERIRGDREHRYLVARFDCSFRPSHDDVEIEWARFRVRLVTEPADLTVRIEDMHPWQVERQTQHHVNLEVAPSLKFEGVEVKAGSFATGYDYESIEPIVSAAGRGGDDVSWDYSSPQGITIVGGKRMHALIRAPERAVALDAELYLSADVRVARRFRWAASREMDEAPLTTRLWSRSD